MVIDFYLIKRKSFYLKLFKSIVLYSNVFIYLAHLQQMFQRGVYCLYLKGYLFIHREYKKRSTNKIKELYLLI